MSNTQIRIPYQVPINYSITSSTDTNLTTTSTSTYPYITIDTDTYNYITNVIGLNKNNSYKLPNGGTLKIDELGNFKIIENNNITYKSCNIREFNKYINASDLLEGFINFLGEQGMKQIDVLKTPIEIFITWLIFKAAEQDKIDEETTLKELEDKTKQLKHSNRCLFCGKFISKKFKKLGINFCNTLHLERYMEKVHI